ncbi:MAG: CRISPR-associated endonuclease Cas1 [Bryobacteraceae bacterium]|nr:CRISPR-associated endonuclease Cas1 [Bryobacteraceae bacterium]
MSALPASLTVSAVPRRTPEQYNWLTRSFDRPAPEQLALPIPPPDEAILPGDESVVLLGTENGSQLLIDGFGLVIGKSSERLVVKRKGKVVAQVPFLKLQEVIVGSRGISVSSDFIEEACRRGIRVGFLMGNGRPYALLTSPLLNATVETRRAQFRACESAVGVEIARWIVAGKLRNQERLLRYFARARSGDPAAKLLSTASSIKRFRRQALAVEGEAPRDVRDSLMGLEGVGGRMYWDCLGLLLPDGGFEGRVHQGPGGPVNAALNYGYSILTAHVWGSAMNAGLEPFAGFLHVERSGKPSLALDLVEEFRQPVVDRALFAWLNKGGKLSMKGDMLDAGSKEEVAARVLARMNARERHRGKEHEVRSIIQMQARLCAAAVRELRSYRPFSFSW